MKIVARLLAWLLLLLGFALPVSVWSADRVRIVLPGPDRGTNAQVVRDIAKYIARPADIDFDLRLSGGTPDTLLRLREGSGQQFAVLQADAAEAYLGAAARGNVEAAQLMAPVRVIAPLHDEDIYFIVRSDSPMNSIHEIADARISLGPLNGGSALTAATLYRLMFGAAIRDDRSSFHTHQDALIRLTEGSVDVAAIVAPRPAQLLLDMKPEARRFIKLLKVDANHPSTAAAQKIYYIANVPAATYPNVLTDDLPALRVKTYLVSHGRNDAIQARFADSWCRNFAQLRSEAQASLPGLEIGLPRLLPGWQYSRPFERQLRACIEGRTATPDSCAQEERALALCS